MPELLSIFLNVITPVFLLVLIGYLVGPPLGIETQSVSRVAYYILTPAFTFNLFSTSNIDLVAASQMGIYIVSVTTICVAVCFVITRILRCSAEMTAAYILITAFGNVGNFGLPIIQFRLGEEALLPAAIYFLVLSFYGFLVGVFSASLHKGGGFGALFSVFKTPAILAVFPAILVSQLNLTVPLFIERSTGLLADAMIPVMLLTLGIQLSSVGRISLDRDVFVASMVRLVIGPVVAIALAVPLGITEIERGAGILQASMPTAVLAVLIAMEHDLMPTFVTKAVLFSTVVSMVTLTIVLTII
ncbi:MAG: AEC family transporter [Chloroflexota bacterium]